MFPAYCSLLIVLDREDKRVVHYLFGVIAFSDLLYGFVLFHMFVLELSAVINFYFTNAGIVAASTC